MLHGLGDPGEIERLRATLAEATGVTVGAHSADVNRTGGVARLVVDAEQALGSSDILVNIAGIQFVSPVDEFPPERWQAVQDMRYDGGELF